MLVMPVLVYVPAEFGSELWKNTTSNPHDDEPDLPRVLLDRFGCGCVPGDVAAQVHPERITAGGSGDRLGVESGAVGIERGSPDRVGRTLAVRSHRTGECRE